MSSEQISADFNMQVSQTGESDLSFAYFRIVANQQNINPMSYLLNLQLLQKEREERHGKRFVMDSSRMTMVDKSIPNMGTGGVH